MGNWDWQVFLQDPGGKIPTYWQWLLSAWGWTLSVSLCALVVALILGSIIGTIRTLPEERYAPLYSLGASFAQVFRFVILPASLPKFITAVRVAMATAVSVLFFTETFGTQYGMGYYIMDAWLRVNYLEMYAGILVLSAMGLLLFGLIDGFERAACRWQRK